MEEVEEANRAAIEGCHKILSHLAHPQDQDGNLRAETEFAASRFRKVVSLLSSGIGHARVKRSKRMHSAFNHKIFMDYPLARHRAELISPKPIQMMIPMNFTENPVLAPQYHQQQQRNQKDMFKRSESSINLKFDQSSSSFLSSLSTEEGSSFQLITGSQTSEPVKRRCNGRGEDGNGKCATSGRCHCSKRRWGCYI